MVKLKLPVDLETHSVIRGTLEGARKSIRKYNRPNFTPKVDQEAAFEAFQRLRQFFQPYYDSCPMAHDEDLVMKNDSSPGFYFKQKYGIKKTAHVLCNKFLQEEMYKFHANPQYPTMWTVSAKQELLPQEKILQNMPRTFIIPDKRLHYHHLKMFHHQHVLFKKLAQLPNSPFACGTSFQYKGFHRIMEEFLGYEVNGEGDCSKWDSSLLAWLFKNVVIPTRAALYQPPRLIVVDGVARPATEEERDEARKAFERELHETYQDMVEAWMMMPDGEVIQKFLGMCSGFFLTSDDNTLIHLFVVFYVEALARAKGHWKLYADDHVFGTKKGTFETFEYRQKAYATFGIDLKKQADRVSDTVEGATFLGYTAHYSKAHSCFVPVYNIHKALVSLAKPDGFVTPEIRYMRISAIRMVCYWTPFREQLRQLALTFYSSTYKDSPNPYDTQLVTDELYHALLSFPTDRAIEQMWLGYECDMEAAVLELLSDPTTYRPQLADGKRKVNTFLTMPNGKGNARRVVVVTGTKPQKKAQKGPRVTVCVPNNPKRKRGGRKRRGGRKGGRPMGGGGGFNRATVGPRNKALKQNSRERGTDVFFELQTDGSPPTTTQVLYKKYVNPMTMIPQSRMAIIARLYEKYHINSLRFYWKTAVAETFSGDSYVWHCSNPLEPYPEIGLPLQQRLTNELYHQVVPVCKEGGLAIPKAQFENAKGFRYYCDPENAQDQTTAYAGQVFIASKGPLIANNDYGTWYVDWDITFWNPQANQIDDTSAGVFVGTAGSEGQSNPLAAPWVPILGSQVTDFNIAVAPASAGSIMTFTRNGIWVIDFFSNGSGGAALTNTSTITSGAGAATVSFIEQAETQTQKVWRFQVTVTSTPATVTVKDTAGTHPTGGGAGTVAFIPAAAPMTMNERNAIVEKQRLGHVATANSKLDFLFKKLGIEAPATMDASYDLLVDDGNNNPPAHITGTVHTDVGVLDVAVIPPPLTKSKRSKIVKIQSLSEDSD